MNLAPAARVLTTLCLDGSLAVLTGLLLALRWLRFRSLEQPWLKQQLLAALPAFAVLLAFACGVHVYLLTAEFTGEASLQSCLRQMPSMLSTHAGRVDAATLGASVSLLIVALLPLQDVIRLSLTSVFLVAALFCRSLSGHAAVNGGFSEAVQLLHLGGMAVWSGGILVSGLYVMPRLVLPTGPRGFATLGQRNASGSLPAISFRSYLRRLSKASTWAVALVFLTGLFKGYRGLGGDVHALRSALWGNVLIAKIVSVSFALSLGALNRFRLHRTAHWTSLSVRRCTFTLRLEALAMLVVLTLSAALGNVSPP